VVVKQFEQQLLNDAEAEEGRFIDQVNDEFESKVSQIEQEKSQQL
jgi:hypothetical protein